MIGYAMDTSSSSVEVVFNTAAPQPASKARLTISVESVQGEAASVNGFKK